VKVGSVVLATEQGLGHLAKSFYDAGVVTHPIVITHSSRATHASWYPERAERVDCIGELGSRRIRTLVEQMDCMLFFETPFDWQLIKTCRGARVKTALVPMYECHPEKQPFSPDLYVCPSLLDLDYFPTSCRHCGGGRRSVHVPVPVDGVEWRQRRRARTFVHNAGHGGLRGRNGTEQVIAALQHVKSDAKFIIRSQSDKYVATKSGIRVEGPVSRGELYDEGDVFLFPDKFDGLSLPLQEASAAGMLVMASDRYPANAWLPRPPLIPVSGYRRARVSSGCLEFDEAIVDPRDIAATVDAWYDRDITEYSQSGRVWASANSWAALKPAYTKILRELCDS
jgi:hypothetical protein